jgi:hypothetical protein
MANIQYGPKRTACQEQLFAQLIHSNEMASVHGSCMHGLCLVHVDKWSSSSSSTTNKTLDDYEENSSLNSPG